jgi:uncharacterized protein (UPF0548 family)
MDVLFPGSPERLSRWQSRAFSPGVTHGPGRRDRQLVFAFELPSEPPGPPLADGAFRRVAAAILRYDVFPPRFVRGVLARTPVEVGDTVGISYRVVAGVRLFFAARVVERFDGADGRVHRAGFRYRTLAGHPELGEETFEVEKDLASGAVRVALRSWSRPGLWLTWLGAPVMRLAQRRASVAALVHLESIATATA